MTDDDIYKTKHKCQYTGLPMFMGECSCFIHRQQRSRNYFQPSVEKVNTLKKSSSHEILMIEPPVTEDEIKKAYRKLCLVHHPDKGGCNDEFIKINNAYNELIC